MRMDNRDLYGQMIFSDYPTFEFWWNFSLPTSFISLRTFIVIFSYPSHTTALYYVCILYTTAVSSFLSESDLFSTNGAAF